MKCIIVDDEPLAREGIELNVKEVNFLELVGQFNNPLAANNFLSENEVDLIFLDIQMPGMTGIEFVRSLKNKPLIIFTTAYAEYALEGFELDVVDYLVKPIRIQRFIKAVNKAKDIYDLQNAETVVEVNNEEDYIYIKSERKYVRLFYKDIKYIKGLKDYVMIYTTNDKMMTAMNIKTINSKLPPSIFARVNKSYIININFIDAIELDFILLGDEEIPLGRTYKEDFIDRYVKTKLIQRKRK